MRKTIAFLALLCLVCLTLPAAARPRYPIKAQDYKKTITSRVESIWSRIDKKLEFHNVSPDRKKFIRHAFDDAAREVWAEVDKASADGSITRDEALRISALTSGLRGKVRGKLATEKKSSAEKPEAKSTTDKAARKSAADKPAPKKTEEPGSRKDARKPAPAAKSSAEETPPNKNRSDNKTKSTRRASHDTGAEAD